MPITIDTTSDNLNEQIKQVNTSIALNKQVDAKYFSTNMTGNGKRKTGLFSVDNDTINTFIKESRRLLEDVALNSINRSNDERHKAQTFGNFFHQSTKEKEQDFQKFELNLTTMIPPVILMPILSGNTPAALSIPKDIGMYNLNALETNWTKITSGIIDGQKATTYARPVIQAMSLYSREKKHQSKSGHVSTESQVVGQPDIYVLFATVLDGMNKEGDMIFANHEVNGGRSVTKNQGVVTIATLDERSRTEYHYQKLNACLNEHLNEVIGMTL